MKKVKCPSCKKLTSLKDNPYRPFCSNRCKVLDLGAWADEKYSVPGESCNAELESQRDDNSEEKKTYH
ncbi:MAG: DNA gyrase inhibitor YacG [Proteobacteria bacterium]|nr:DNA gyrase inhibitor YacG [Pseudomonadota bacterium]